MGWQFYGRRRELEALQRILGRGRWFFARISGRRRIGKTTLIQQALAATGPRDVLYIQIPDSTSVGVLSAVGDAMDLFGLDRARFPTPSNLRELARLIGELCSAGYIVVIDEFQYFSRRALYEFTSHLQAVVDGLSSRAETVPGGLFVLGSLHAELMALLEDRSAPLYNRTTDHIELDHLDIGSLRTLLRTHADDDPSRLLFLWNLFEGVPKFYRDCYEQGVLAADRAEVLARMFFDSSSPLRTEADNWFLSELKGQYDVVLKFVARSPGCTHGELVNFIREISPMTTQQVGGYLKILIERYRMVEKRLPIFEKGAAKKSRYYLRDNFLRAWLSSLATSVASINFRPEEALIAQADARLAESEGFGLERLVGLLYEERSRKAVGDFALTHRIEGYWDRAKTEIDLVALDEASRTIRFGSCKRSMTKLVADLPGFEGHVERFLDTHRSYREWTVQKVAIAPTLDPALRAEIEGRGYLAQSLGDLLAGLD